MAYRFKRKLFGFMDLLRFKHMTDVRRAKLQEGSSAPLPTTYRVNETAKVLYPGTQWATLEEITTHNGDTKTYTFQLTLPVFFRAGQYVTVRAKVGESLVARPYAISSSPEMGLRKKLSVTVKKAGFFSDYLYDNAKVGDRMEIGDPSGEFYYESLTDTKHILAIAGGSGITPFYSLAQSIHDGTEDCTMTLIYGAKTLSDLVFKQQLDELVSDKFNVVYVLSDEKADGCEYGFITKELLAKYTQNCYTTMLCGSNGMYKFVDQQLKDFGVNISKVKHEPNCVGLRDVENKTFTLTVHIRDKKYTVKASNRETILVAMERAGLYVPSKCRAGGCGFCHSKLVSGKFSLAGADKRRLADAKFGYIHPCCSYPDSDMELIVPKG